MKLAAGGWRRCVSISGCGFAALLPLSFWDELTSDLRLRPAPLLWTFSLWFWWLSPEKNQNQLLSSSRSSRIVRF